MKTRAQWKDEAYEWACGYIESQELIDMQCVFEGMSEETWQNHLDFITDCFEHGHKPTHFVDTRIQSQAEFNEWFDNDAESWEE